MYKKELETGEQFGDWTIISTLDKRQYGYVVYKVKCKCGKESEFNGSYLRSGKSKCCRSCSAIKRIPKAEKNKFFRHGATLKGNPVRPTYKVWVAMRQRCNDPNSRDYKNYGERGISICDEWNTFEEFHKDMGTCPAGLS